MSTHPHPKDRIVSLERVRAADLCANPKAWRRHPARQRAMLRALIDQIGYADVLIARRTDDGSLELIDGHLRRAVHPEAILPVLVVNLTEAEADILLATLDPLAALARPDSDGLARLLEAIPLGEGPLAELLSELARSAGIVRGLRKDPEDAPPLPKEPLTAPGDLWELGEHRLVCGDATSGADLSRVLPAGLADCLWTDPPYGVSYVGKTASKLRIKNDGPGDLDRLLAGAFAAADSVLRPGAALYVAHPAGALSVVFGERFVAQGWRLRQSLVWAKDCMVLGRSDYHYQHEPILYGHKPGPGRWGRGAQGWYGGNRQTTLLEVARPKASREHPTAKPVELIRRCLVNSTREGDIVLDPFLGSGSTLIACEVLARRCVATELDPRYCDVAVRRWEEVTGEKAKRVRSRRAG